MEKYVELFNKLYQVVHAVDQDVDFPQIVVVGSQSDGKSSVLESISTASQLCKTGFLPRGAGVVTRTPIMLQLVRVPSGSAEYVELSYDSIEQPIIIKDFDQVSIEICNATEKLTGGKKNIVNKVIRVKLFSTTVSDLTMIDLPGLVENRAGDQPEDIKQQVERLVRYYVENPNSIILAVHQATTDLANSKSLSMARSVDPDGKRTICVITKLDLVEQEIDKTNLLNGQEIAQHHSKVMRVIGVINKSQADYENKKDTSQKEDIFFSRKPYRSIKSQHGSKVLAEFLSSLFKDHLKKSIPGLKASLDARLASYKDDLASYGEPLLAEKDENDNSLDNENRLVLRVIDNFCSYYLKSLDGDVDQGTKELRGGSRIQEIFNGTFWNGLEIIQPLDGITEQDAWMQIRNSQGIEKQLFPSEKAFRFLTKTELKRMEKESIKCVKLVHQEMLLLRDLTGNQIGDVREQYPIFFEEIQDAVALFLQRAMEETKKMVEHCVQMQHDYINIHHPDFKKAQDEALIKFSKLGISGDKNKSSSNDDSDEDAKSTSSALVTGPNKPNKPPVTRPVPRPPGGYRGRVAEDDSDEEVQKGTAQPVKPPSPTQARRDVNQNTESPLSEREKLECEIIQEVVRQYFTVIRVIVRDSVPKVIVRFMINAVKRNIQSELLSKLAVKERYLNLLRESDHTGGKRKELLEKFKACENASILVRELSAA